MKSVILTVGLALSGLGISVSAFATSTETAVQDAKTKVFDLIDKDSSTVDFQGTSAIVSESEKKDLKAVVDAVKKDGKVEKVIVAAWSNQEYPATEGETLSKTDRALADSRASAIKKTLESFGLKHIETYSMAEKPSWIAKTFNTEDSKLKGTGKVRDANDKLANEIGQTLRDKGGPGKAVVLVRRVGDL